MPKKRTATASNGQNGNALNRVSGNYENEIKNSLREPRITDVTYKIDEIVKDDIKEFKDYVLDAFDVETSEDKIVQRFLRTALGNDTIFQNWKADKVRRQPEENAPAIPAAASNGNGDAKPVGTKTLAANTKTNGTSGLPSETSEEGNTADKVLEGIGA